MLSGVVCEALEAGAMKVALFVHCFFPNHFYGTETYTLELARNLLALGHQPIVVTAIFPGEPTAGRILSTYKYDDIPVYCIDKNFFVHRRVKDTYYQVALHNLIRDVLCEIRPDIVHVTHLINHTAVLLDVVAELNLVAVATLTDFFGFCFNNKLVAADGSLCEGPNQKRSNCSACYLRARSGSGDVSLLGRWAGSVQWARLAGSLLVSLANVNGVCSKEIAEAVHDIRERPDILTARYSKYRAVIAPTQFLKNAYVANGLRAPIHLSRFGVDLPRRPKLRRAVDGPVRFGFIGQIASHKGVDILVEAFCRLPRGIAELHVFGPTDQAPGYMNSMKRVAEKREVHFRGVFPKDAMADVLSQMDFIVIPSQWHENSPLILLCALASHTPVIVSDVAGLTEFVEEGENGYWFQRGNVDDLERVLRRILDEPSLLPKMTVKTDYPRTTRMMTQDVLEIYKGLGVI